MIDVLTNHQAGEGLGRETDTKEADTRAEQIVWKKCMFLTVVNTAYFSLNTIYFSRKFTSIQHLSHSEDL